MSGRLLRTVCTGVLAATTALAGVPTATADDPADPQVEAPVEAPVAPAVEASEEAPVDPAVEASEEASEEVPEEAPADPPVGSPAGDAAELPPPGGDSVVALLTRLQTLYRQAEQATEAHNATDEALRLQTADTKKVGEALTRARERLAQGRNAAGRLAREQYQGRAAASAFSPYLRLLLSDDPRHALDQGHLMDRAARDRATAVTRLTAAEKKAGELATASRKALDRQRTLTTRQKKQRDDVQQRLKDVQKLLASLPPDQLTRLTELERTQTAGAQRELLDTGVLDGDRTPSRAGGEALRYAVRQIGKPYVWGAEGPESYDCSGLTSQAWASAGREIPRTSQEQWRTLPRVPLRELRPGDLVVYFPEATHVAIYLGHGLVVQAPRPGTKVKVSPIAANPLLGAVRPDPTAVALTTYTPPELPAGATDGADEGFDQGGA
ncbi:NlpC/P60 family protein [Streptomyces sp. P9(2023)]|uniref:C40 family peptidase n=1 Tax=Streptomyces sp. P9(2023) TaxID=3064394 RepID=UPI0028F43A6C|nr:NlpC/P60 family protein [Streptomyces sp. P9(2023)]MDT9693743.1 NlpC/P60 family protein [Streptomyces sp. P9(2023)]